MACMRPSVECPRACVERTFPPSPARAAGHCAVLPASSTLGVTLASEKTHEGMHPEPAGAGSWTGRERGASRRPGSPPPLYSLPPLGGAAGLPSARCAWSQCAAPPDGRGLVAAAVAQEACTQRRRPERSCASRWSPPRSRCQLSGAASLAPTGPCGAAPYWRSSPWATRVTCSWARWSSRPWNVPTRAACGPSCGS